MDDEWFVVYLLRRMTEVFDVAVQVWDEDGEFLLIEAAYSLPDWLEPSVSANRIWVYRGTVHCLPMSVEGACGVVDGEIDDNNHVVHIDVSTPSVALQSLVTYVEEARSCGEGIDACVGRKLAAYPELAEETMMRATACLPRRVARALAANPQRVSAMVAAYGSSSAKERMRVATGPIWEGNENDLALVPMVVVFNRWLYGQAVFSHDDGAIDALMSRCGPYRVADDQGGQTQVETKTELETKAEDRKAAAMKLGFRLALGNALMPAATSTSLKSGELLEAEDGIEIPVSFDYARDDESWMHAPSSRLNEELDERERELDGEDGLRGFHPDDLTGRMRQFVQTMSSMDGAEVNDEEVAFDPETFLSILRGDVRQESDDDSDEGSSFYDMSGDEQDDEDELDDEDDVEAAMRAELEEKLVGADEALDVDLAVVENLLSSIQVGDDFGGGGGRGAAGPANTLSAMLGVNVRMRANHP